MLKQTRNTLLCAVLVARAFPSFAADPMTEAVDATLEAHQKARASQQTVNGLDDQTRSALEKYRNVLWQAQQQTVYAQQLEAVAAGQAAEKASLEKQFASLDDTEREILPLLLRMHDSLEKFVALDLPFLVEERRERLAALKRVLADGQTNIAEKYRRVTEAYRIEADYGRNLGVERTELPLGGTAKIVDVLRVGRTALYYLSLDGDEVGTWDAAQKRWVSIERRYRAEVRKGLRVARETTAPSLMVLPVTAGGAP